MERVDRRVGRSPLAIEFAIPRANATSLVERKGHGHPDTLADHLAEALSRAYSSHTLHRFGAVLHHNFDKLALLGGSSEVRYGSGRMTSPVRILINGRAARSCGGERIPVEELMESTALDFFRERLPAVAEHLELRFNITENPSPGAVVTEEGGVPERNRWFAPRGVNDLRERQVLLANDTSLGTGWAPEGPLESLVRELTDTFSRPSAFTRDNAWCGNDVKVMGYWDGRQADIILCVPQLSSHVASRNVYLENKETVLAECRRLADLRLPGIDTTIRLNTRDVPERDELYLTYTGSSIESGDEGVVGRGNRVNGLITPLIPMNLEGANGKNPVYHVGKLYNLAAVRLAQRIHEETGDHAEVHMMSVTGQRLDQPGRVLVRLATAEPQLDKVQALVAETLESFPALTEELVHEGVLLS